MAIKTQYVVYTSKNFTTGLTDITANVFKDGGAVAVATGLALSQVNASDSKGRYLLTLTPTQINSFGGVGVYTIVIDSTSKSAPATAKLVIQANDNDDISAQVSTVSGNISTINTKVDALQTDITSVKSTVEDTNTKVSSGTFGLSAIKALIDTAISGITSIQQATRTVVGFPSELITPATGSKVYEILINIYNNSGSLEDPDSNSVQVSLKNSAGLDRGNLFQGGGASPKAATRLSTGRYKIMLEIPAGASKEQINMIVNYTENVIPLEAIRSANLIDEVQASGLAQQVTVQAILDDTSVIQPEVSQALGLIQDANFGLSALKTALNSISALVTSNNNVLLSATIGNQAIIDAITTKASQTSVNNIIADLVLVKGTGFDTSIDSLKAISERQFTGGSAI